MREILFRGKRKDSGEWVEGYLLRYSPIFEELSYVLPIPAVAVNEVEVDSSTVCQYTGLTDKNGRKIFEGDIVRVPDFTFEVSFQDGCFGGHFDSGFSAMFKNIFGYRRENAEVIGNIFDNPELIEAEVPNGI